MAPYFGSGVYLYSLNEYYVLLGLWGFGGLLFSSLAACIAKGGSAEICSGSVQFTLTFNAVVVLSDIV